MGVPSKNDHFGVFWGVPPFTETPIYIYTLVIYKFKPKHVGRYSIGLLHLGGCLLPRHTLSDVK